MNIFRHFLAAALTLSVIAGNSQDYKNSVSLGWGGSIPAGGGNFSNTATMVAPYAEWEYSLSQWFSVGASAGYVYGSEKGDTRERVNGDIVDGYSERTLSLVPLQARLRYFPLGGNRPLRPYVSASGGAQYAKFDITGDAILSSGVKNWAGLFSAGAGVRFYPNPDKDFFLGLGGAWQWAGNKFKIMDTNAQRSVEIRIEAGFPIF